MKLYIAYSRAAGSEEGAILVAAHTSREAKKLAWRSGDCWNIDGCENCHIWGAGLDRDDMCSWCGEPPGEGLIEALANERSRI